MPIPLGKEGAKAVEMEGDFLGDCRRADAGNRELGIVADPRREAIRNRRRGSVTSATPFVKWTVPDPWVSAGER